jgi:hypothetical protein
MKADRGHMSKKESRRKEARGITVLQASSLFPEAGTPFLLSCFVSSDWVCVARILCEGNLITFAQFKARMNSLRTCKRN